MGLQQRTPFPIGNLGFASPMPRASLRHAFPTGNLRSSRDHPGTCPIMRAEIQRLRDENSRLRAELQRVRLVRSDSEPRSEEGELASLCSPSPELAAAKGSVVLPPLFGFVDQAQLPRSSTYSTMNSGRKALDPVVEC